MKDFKKLVAAATIVGILGVVGVAGAAGVSLTPAGIASAVSGMTAEEVTAARAAGKTYGAIAQEAGKLEEFKTENLVQKKAVLKQRVADGFMTQAQADAILKSIEANYATCDTTGNAGIGRKNGMGFGQMGAGQNYAGNGGGMGQGRGPGMGRSFNKQ